MFRFGPFGAHGLAAGRPGSQGKPDPPNDLLRLAIVLMLALVVGGLSLGFFMRGSAGEQGPAVPTDDAGVPGPKPIPVGDVRVKNVPDPGDPDSEASAPDGVPKHPVRPPPYVENPKIFDGVDQNGTIIGGTLWLSEAGGSRSATCSTSPTAAPSRRARRRRRPR